MNVRQQRIVLIGAGSAVFTQGLIADMIQTPDTRWDVRLVDIDDEALESVACLVERMIEAKGADIVVSSYTDRRDALPEADIVVTTVAVGGRRAWEADVFIPRRWGIYQPVGDTAMPGGISRALRMIPVMLSIAKDIQTWCPQAWFFNYSNPMTAICRAIHRETSAVVTGLCHGVHHVESYLAKAAGVPLDQVTSLAIGLNHLTFVYDLRWKGLSLWPLLDVRLAREEGRPYDTSQVCPELREFLNSQSPETSLLNEPFAWSLYKNLGAYPAVNDRHVTEFYPEIFASGTYYGKTLGVDAFSFETTIRDGDQDYANMRAQAKGEKALREDLFQRAPGEHEQLMEILDSISHDKRRTYSVNLPNSGSVPNVFPHGVLELPAAACATGFRPLQASDFPDLLAARINRHLATVEITVEAALSGRMNLVVEALLSDGSCRDRSAAEGLAGELIEAHRDHLPQFA